MLMRHMHMGIIMDIMIACFIIALLLSSLIHPRWCCNEDNTAARPLSTLFAALHCIPFVFTIDAFVNSCARLAFQPANRYNNDVY